MSEKQFAMRMQCDYQQPDNSVAALHVEQQTSAGWQLFEVGNRSPGFDIYVYAMLVCQHTYFRLNCAEQGLLLKYCDGQLSLNSDDQWALQDMDVRFIGQLAEGSATPEAIAYIEERMGQCPVSLNMNPSVVTRTRVELT